MLNIGKKSVSYPLKNKNNDQLFTIRYEDFSVSPEENFKKIMKFLELEMQDQQLHPKVFGNDRRSKRTQFQRLSTSISSDSVAKDGVQK